MVAKQNPSETIPGTTWDVDDIFIGIFSGLNSYTAPLNTAGMTCEYLRGHVLE